MNPIKSSWQNVQDAIRLWDNPNFDKIKRICQASYYELCRKTNWISLRRTKETTVTALETDGIYLPSNLIGITAVISKVSGEEKKYYPTDESKRYMGDGKYHWYYINKAVATLENPLKGISINENATTFTASTAFTADHTGEYVRFSSEPGLYEITKSSATFKTMTITPSYKGGKISNKGCIVRPEDTKKICIIDPDGDLTADTVTIYYWAYPEPLYRDFQVPMLPGSRPLELMTIIAMIGLMDKKESVADKYREELNGLGRWDGHGALDEMMSKNPVFLAPMIPRDRRGKIIYFGRQRDNG